MELSLDMALAVIFLTHALLHVARSFSQPSHAKHVGRKAMNTRTSTQAILTKSTDTVD